ncbi:glycosyltransferase, partial [Moorena sp. SIO3I6]|uniref:glycosyltransferase n=1 Tax=Moorena sp. SIO3I6 TaxID=2607831 RepID=UPI0013F8D7E9
LGYSSQNSCVIPNGFDTSLFKPSLEARAAFRSELGLSEQSILIGLIGRYHPMKDHPNFIRAASLLVKEFPDVHFIMVGTEVDQDNNFLSSLIQDLGLSNHIHLLGERSDIPRLTAALDINTLASAYGEAFPLVIGEAMSSGVPCVVTDVGDSAWIVGNTGRVVPPRNSEALARAWKELILMGNEGRKVLGKAARSRIIDSFSINSVVAQYESLYELILD